MPKSRKPENLKKPETRKPENRKKPKTVVIPKRESAEESADPIHIDTV